MLFQILKKDILKRAGINLILFLFITLATIFLASSINNIIVVSSGIDYYMNYANVPDINIITNSNKEKDEIDKFLKDQLNEKKITDFEYSDLIMLSDKSVKQKRNGQIENYESNGATLYLSKLGDKYNKVYNENGKDFTLKKGEIGLSLNTMNKNNLDINDKIIININNVEKEFIIKEKIKDAAYGNDTVGMIRFIVSDEDYIELEKDSFKLGIYNVMTDTIDSQLKEINNKSFSTVVNTVSRSTYKLVYVFDMLMAALLILIGICLILISLLVLRFTLTFTLEEQYQEIGILKAIGFRNFSIKKIYLIKYFVIVLLGASLGLIFSFPVSSIMISSVSKNIIMMSSSSNFIINILCALFIIVFVVIFCYLCTRKLNKVSAITAIHGGKTGERYNKKKGLDLAKRKHLKVTSYLGINDIFMNIRRYIVLIITFSISFILITIPLNTLNTMRSNEMIEKFLLNPDSNILVRSIELETEGNYHDTKELNQGLERLKNELNDKGYEDINITASQLYFLRFYDNDSNQKQTIMSAQLTGDKTNYLKYSSGVAPILENEVAFSEDIMKENNWNIGDYVNAIINGEEKSLIITGTYSDYMQLGKSARLNATINCDKENVFDYWAIMIEMKTNYTSLELKNVLKEQFPDYEWNTAQELIDQNVGGVQDSLKDMIIPMTAMLCAIIMLITLLMERLFIARERGEIAMLKSIGLKNKDIRRWQVIRMTLVVIVSMIIAVPLSFLSNQFMLKPIFAIMGADVAIQVDIWNVYLLYPLILLICIIVATFIATKNIKKVDIRELNILE